MSQKTVEDSVFDVVGEILKGEAIEEAFCSVILHTKESETWKKDYCTGKLKNLLLSTPQDSLDLALRTYVAVMYDQNNASRVNLMASLLESMVENNIIPARPVCEAILNQDRLHHEVPHMWTKTFQLLKKIIGGVEYKGCRDLLRSIMEKIQGIPEVGNISLTPQIDVVVNVVNYILDRNVCLLPAYLAVNEITKVCPEDKVWPHWRLGKLLSDFVNSFRPAAQMVTVSGRAQLLPIVGHSLSTGNVWRLNSTSLRFPLNGPLPYDKVLSEAQTGLLRYVLEQPYSRDMVGSMLGLNKQVKQRCEVLEEQLVDLVVMAMERSENDDVANDECLSQLLWQHLSSQVIYFVLFQFASFPHMVMSLYDKLKGRNLNKGRDHLMWVLLQFISGSIQKNPLTDFLPVMKLYDLLYSDTSIITMPDTNKASSTHALSSTCIWIHLNKKAQTDKVQLPRPMPNALQDHLEYLKQCVNNKNMSLNDYKIALLCNAYSTNNEYFNLPMGKLVESIYGDSKHTTLLPGNIVASSPTQPLPMSLLDSLTVHAKMSLIHSIVHRVIRQAKTKSPIAPAPALVETYSRLLVYMEIESLGIKGFISQLLPTVFTSHAWGILHTLLEMFSYRLHHTQPHYRVQLLGHLHTLYSFQQTNQNQLQLCVESTALRLITGLGSAEVQPQLSRLLNEPNRPGFLSGDSEELNRALVLTLARSMHITGVETFSSNWFREILTQIMQSTPHSWTPNTLACFPPSLAEFYQQNPVAREDKAQLKHRVDTEYKKWKSMANESDIIAHFSMQGTPPLFLCIIWKNMLDESRVPPIAYKNIKFSFRKKKPPTTKSSTEKKARADKSRAYREQLKQIPQLHELTKNQHASHMRDKRSEWDEEQKQKNREQSRNRMKAYRERKRAQEKANDENQRPYTRQEQDKIKEKREEWKSQKQKQRANLSSQKKRRIREKDRERKRKVKDQRHKVKVQSETTTCTSTDENPSHSEEALRKATFRAKKKLPRSPNKYAEVVTRLVINTTPRKTQALRNKGIGSPKAKQRLDMLTETLSATYKSMEGRQKEQVKLRRAFVKQLASNIKHRNASSLCNRLGINRKFLTRNVKERKLKKRKDALDEDTLQSIGEFYKMENVSVNVPNKKAVDKAMNSKFVLQDSYRGSYDKWRSQNPNKKVSFSKFIEVKPKDVLKQSRRQLIQCLCEYCENVRLKIQAVNKYDGIKIDNKFSCASLIMCPKVGESQFHDLACIQRTCATCSAQPLEDILKPLCADVGPVKYKSWDLVRYENRKTGKISSKRELVETSLEPKDFIQKMVTAVTFLAKHLFEAEWQQTQIGTLVKNVARKQVVITADFAENYTCFSQNEIQGAHWMRNLITIHPTIVNYRCAEDDDIVEEAIDIVSDDHLHNADAFHAFHKKVFEHLSRTRNLEVEEQVIVSDGCASQYKGKISFMDASMGLEDFGTVIERVYYGSRHGKNRCDGEGGILKSKVTRGVKSGEVVISNAKDFALYCQKTLTKPDNINGNHNHKRRTIIYVQSEEINRDRPSRQIKTVKGTQQFHSVKGVSKGVIWTRKLSCFCERCRNKDYGACLSSRWVDNWKQSCLIPTVELRPGPDPLLNDPAHPVADNTDEGLLNISGVSGILDSLESQGIQIEEIMSAVLDKEGDNAADAPKEKQRVLDRLGPRALSSHLRTFADFMVYELNLSGVSGQNVNKFIETLSDMVWRYNIVTIDRLVLCVALRNFDENEARLCYLIIHMLLLKPAEFKTRIHDFVRENSPEHWLQSDWHDKHMAFHRKHPEKFYYEGIQDLNSPIQHQYLPVYFGNVCLRFIPVLDILIHRIIEQPTLQNLLEKILENLGILYKFHDHPITYLYNTLHYYQRNLINRPPLKRKLVQSIMNAHKDIRPNNWFLSEDYQRFIQEDNLEWNPDLDYYVRLIGRLVDTINNKTPSPFPNCDWRFNEFPSPAAHALYVTCVELMSLPVHGNIVGRALLDVVLKNCTQLMRSQVVSWMNAVGLVLTALPDTYWSSLNGKVEEVVRGLQPNMQPFHLFNFSASQSVFADQHCSYVLALTHAIWHHAGIGQLSQLPQFLRETLKPVVVNEQQFLYLCHLVGPFLQRLHSERTRCLMELVVELYEILVGVDKNCEHLHYMDAITDFLYHIKYMFVGDGVKNEVEKLIRNLRQPLQVRLRFISHINIEEAMTPLAQPMSA